MKPRRIQLSRRKGWRKPEGAIVVARPSKWENPFKVGVAGKTAGWCVHTFREWLLGTREGQYLADEAKKELRGKSLCCWCRLGQPCHADVLLEIANGR